MNGRDVTVEFTGGESVWETAVGKNTGGFELDDKGVFTIANTGEEAGRYSCPKGQKGKYETAWDASCAEITFKLVDDPCKGRQQAMNGIELTRKK